MEFKDYYQTLESVAKDAKRRHQKAYRSLRVNTTQTSSKANAEEKFKTVQEAYEVLKKTLKNALLTIKSATVTKMVTILHHP